jgi:type IV secretory pathway component VirB8
MQARIVASDTLPGSMQDVIKTNYIATVTFEYRKIEMSPEDMLLNPLGFLVLNYQIQQEVN